MNRDRVSLLIPFTPHINEQILDLDPLLKSYKHTWKKLLKYQEN